jgi:two-component system chemotaxis sensor kinase CheA
VNDWEQEIVAAFLEESRENLDQLDRDLVALEGNPSDPALLGEVFRTIHTIKGTCGFLGFRRLESLTHAGENLLGALRNGNLRLDAGITTTLLALVDAVRHTLDLIERTGAEGEADHTPVITALDHHLAPPAGGASVPSDGPAPDAGQGATPDTTVRVNVETLGTLMDLVGELVLTRGTFAEVADIDNDGLLFEHYRQLRRITDALKDSVMRARLQPIGSITGRFRRVVRDLAATMGKQISISIDGEDIAIDKAVNEALRDPLLHLVRNAVDHGIEPPSERLAAGKPLVGRVTVCAFQEGSRVHIEVADDGRGIDVGRLTEVAIEDGLLSRHDAGRLGREDAMELVFRPGLTTKEEVSTISGRGVGMDVVRSAVAQVGGIIEMTSEPGRGSSFRLTVPLTLAITPALITTLGTQRYAVPQADVGEIVRVTQERVDGIDGLRHRDDLLPVVHLATTLGVAPSRHGDGVTVIVVEAASHRFGLVVDGVGDATDVVVKPLPRSLGAIPQFGGVTILGDGDPALVLDVAGLASCAGVAATQATDAAALPPERTDAVAMYLVGSGGRDGHFALDMSVVRRVEHIPAASVRRLAGLESVLYDDGVLPLVRVTNPQARRSAPDLLPTVVCRSSVGLIGLIVGSVDDIASEVDGRPTGLLDVEALVADAGLA